MELDDWDFVQVENKALCHSVSGCRSSGVWNVGMFEDWIIPG